MRKLKALVCAALTMCIIAVPITSSVVFNAGAEEDVQSLQNKIDELEEQSAKYQKILDDTEAKLSEKEAYGKTLVEKIEVMNKKVILIREAIDTKDKEIVEGNKALEEQVVALCGRLSLIYKAGSASNLEILLGAKNYSDFIDKLNLVKLLSKYDKEMIDNINDRLETVKADKAEKEQQEAALKKEIESLNKLVTENEAVLADISQQSSEARAALMNNSSLISQHEAEIAQYFAEQEEARRKAAEEQAALEAEAAAAAAAAQKRAQEEAEQQARQAEQQQQSSSSSSSSGSSSSSSSSSGSSSGYDDYDDDDDYNSGSSSSGSGSSSGGGYTWPCPGYYYLSSLWNEDRYTYNHGAIDIAGGDIMGARVVAADSGTVSDTVTYCTHNWGKSSSCGCGGGYGNYVWINHGNGKETIYAHLTSVVVSPGQYVSKGQTIGYVGSTGHSTGPHLHFECRYNGVRYNPMNEF